MSSTKICFSLALIAFVIQAEAQIDKFKAFRGTRSVGEVTIERKESKEELHYSENQIVNHFSQLTQITFLKSSQEIKSMKLVSRAVGSEKPIVSVNIDVEGKKLLVRRLGLKGIKNSMVMGFQEKFVPRSFLPEFFISQKENSPNVPHKFEVFDDRTIKFFQGEWIYLGLNKKEKKFIHQYEVRGDLRLIVTLSDNRQLLSVEDYSSGITYKRDLH